MTSGERSARSGEAQRRTGVRADAVAGRLALAGSTLGVLAGVLELTVGPSMRHWVGDKQDTTRLGVTTIILSAVALAGAALLRRPAAGGGRRVAVALALLLPALICLTTAGRLWYLPAGLLLAAGLLVLRRTTGREIADAFTERHWRVGLLVLCGIYYILLGVTALGITGVLGVLGGLLVCSAARVAARAPRAAYALVLCGALPFAAATWWSVITPLIALLTIVIAHSVIHPRADVADRVGPRDPGGRSDAAARVLPPPLATRREIAHAGRHQA